MKKKILLISLLNALSAIQAFARGGSVKETTPNEISFAAKVKTADEIVIKYLEESRAVKSPDNKKSSEVSTSTVQNSSR